MPITVLDREEIEKQMQSTGTALDETLVVSKASDFGIRVKKLSEALFGIYVQVGTIEADLFVSGKTSTEALEKHAEARFGSNPRKGATIASGTDAVDITGDPGAVVGIGETLTSADGQEYRATSGDTLDANGEGNISVESTTKGAAANRDIGEKLTFSSAPVGIDAEAVVVAAIDGGEDQETDGELLKRVLDAYANPPAAGRASDWRQWGAAVEGVVAVYVYVPSSLAPTGRRGLGIVDLVVLKRGTGASRIPSETVRLAVIDYLETKRPVTTKEYSVMLPATQVVPVDVELTPKTGFGFDFTDLSLGGRTVGSWAPSTLILTLDDDVDTFSDDIAVGDRVLVNGQLSKVLELPPTTGSDEIKIQPLSDDESELSDFADTPGIGDSVYPAGPLTGPAIIAIKAYMDSLGPARGAAADPEQDWDDTVRVNALDAILIDRGIEDGIQIGVPGVLDTKTNLPAANVVPVDGAPSGVPVLCIYGTITPRPADS